VLLGAGVFAGVGVDVEAGVSVEVVITVGNAVALRVNVANEADVLTGEGLATEGRAVSVRLPPSWATSGVVQERIDTRADRIRITLRGRPKSLFSDD
jgi:hypothetical protein